VEGGFEAWKAAGEETDLIINIEADELAMDIPFDDKLVILDVRKPAEFAEGHVKDALNIPVNDLTDPLNIASFEEDQNIYVHCQGGYRSMIATSLLKREGIHNLRNIVGGYNKIKEEPKIKTEKEKSVLN
jgi:hydroxyacylglutathione hydrolase